VLLGGLAGLAVGLARRGYRRWRARRDARSPHGAQQRAVAIAYRAPERRLARLLGIGVALLVVVGSVPSSARRVGSPPTIVPTPLLYGTPLAGAEVSGPLYPVFQAAADYVRKYFADTDSYYAQLRQVLLDRLAVDPPTLPSGEDVVNLGFVTDRHCNTGMDRVVVALLGQLDVHLLVSGGDDAFSGSFGFESACTEGLASASKRARITDVFVGGNHDSPMTLDDERQQGIQVLDGTPVSAEGLTFVGLPDPRTSRYGQGIQPSAPEAQKEVVTAQGQQAGALACRQDGPVIIVLHDPLAGRTALQNGCGRAVLALDGHTHRQQGPDTVPLPDGSTGYAFTGASTGGAPSDRTIVRSFASRLTVGPLQHDATLNIVSVDRATGRLVAVTECHITPDQIITFDQQLVGT
jgi:hypothetical protein